MEPGAFIPQKAREFLARVAVKVTKDGQDAKMGTTYNLPDGSIRTIEGLFPIDLNYGHLPEEGISVRHKIVMEVGFAPVPGLAFAAVIKNRNHKGGPLSKLANKSKDPGTMLFTKSVPFRLKNGYHGPFCRTPENCIRILVTDGIYLYHVEVALVSQAWNGNPAYAVTKQISRHGRLYRNANGTVGFTHFDEWPEMIAVIAELIGDTTNIPFFGSKGWTPTPSYDGTEKARTLRPKTGVVEWWSYALQTGCATTEDFDSVKIFAEQMKRPGAKLAFAVAGEVIGYERIELVPMSGTEFRHQLSGCRVIEPGKTLGRTEKFQLPFDPAEIADPPYKAAELNDM